MNIGSQIAQYRKQKGITQEALAQLLNVTNQAVSKWESDQCCPDIQILPKLADTFGISIDALFERETASPITREDLPWEDDGSIRVVLYLGHQLLKISKNAGDFVFRYEGPARNVISAVQVNCGDVEGNVEAGTGVNCGNVGGDVDAGGDVSCGDVEGDVDAGSNVTCGNVGGDVDAGSDVTCGDVEGDVDAGRNVTCGKVNGNVDAGTSVYCGNVGGDVDSGSDVTCAEVHGDIDAGGNVTIKKSGN